MTINFKLPIKPFSVNKMSTRDQRFRTPEFKVWATTVLAYLEQLPETEALKEFGKQHDAKNTYYVRFVYNYTSYEFYNKRGEVSAKTIDMTNGGKPLLDLILGDFVNINDRYVVKFTEEKRPSDENNIEVLIMRL